MSSTANMTRCRPSVLGGGFSSSAPTAAGARRNVAGQRPYYMSGTPGWIVILGPPNATKSHITTQPVSGRVFDITATAGSIGLGAGLGLGLLHPGALGSFPRPA
jgi:hypothetical protein